MRRRAWAQRRFEIVIALVLVVGCGNDDPRATPAATPSPVATAVACPSSVTVGLDGARADVDFGSSGIVHDSPLSDGVSFTLGLACPEAATGGCGVCEVTGVRDPAAAVSHRRCADAIDVACTRDEDCPGSRCDRFFSPPFPLSAGGAPACVVDRVAEPVTGSFTPAAGELDTRLRVEWVFHLAIALERPCPVCSGGELGAAGACVGGPRDGATCRVHATNAFLGNTSFDCPPNPSLQLSNVPMALDLTTGTRRLDATENCTGDSVSGRCYCPGQVAPNDCTTGQCDPGPDGDGVCVGGPTDRLCVREPFRPCAEDSDCPAPGDVCGTRPRECSGMTDADGSIIAPLEASGSASPSTPVLVGLFCVPLSSAAVQNQALGMPGPTRLRIPASLCAGEGCSLP